MWYLGAAVVAVFVSGATLWCIDLLAQAQERREDEARKKRLRREG